MFNEEHVRQLLGSLDHETLWKVRTAAEDKADFNTKDGEAFYFLMGLCDDVLSEVDCPPEENKGDASEALDFCLKREV